MKSHWFDSLDGTSIDLWSALVSTACACVNNPQNGNTIISQSFNKT